MKKTFCDRCKNEIVGIVFGIKIMDKGRRDVWWGWDLCEKCRDEIEREVRE